jgi:hypothetical protein
MKKLLIIILLLFPALALAAPQRVEEALQANKEMLQYFDRLEIGSYVDSWCYYGKESAEIHLWFMLDNKIDEAVKKIKMDDKIRKHIRARLLAQ